MKLEARRIRGFLADPGNCRVVLLHGDDEGLIRERSRALTIAVVGSSDDPFRLSELEREQSPRLVDEALALSMTGGRRVVRLRDTGDGQTSAVQAVLRSKAEALVLLEAPGLSKGRLRTLLEAAPDAAVIACYAEDGRALQDTIKQTLAAQDVSIEPEALDWTSAQLAADRGSVRLEIEKLALFVGAGSTVDLAAAQASLGDSAALSFDDALTAACQGRSDVMDRALELAFADGVAPVAALRQTAGHFQRLLQARLLVEDGMPPNEALRSLRLPVYFKRAAALEAMLLAWSSVSMLRILEEVRSVELSSKQTGAKPDLLCRRLLAIIAFRAQRARLVGARG